MEGFNPLALLSRPDFVALFAHGLEITFVIAAGSWVLGMTVAVLLLAGRMTASRPLGIFVSAYISYHRNVPTLVQLMLWYFGIASLLPDAMQEWLADHDG